MWLKVSTAVTIKFGPFLDSTDGVTAETGLTISQADIRLSKNGGNIAQSNNVAGATHDELGYYDVPLDTTDTNTLGTLRVAVSESGALPVWQDFMVVPANVWDSLFSTDKLQVDTVEVSGTTQTANDVGADVNAILVDTGTTLDGKINTIDTNVDSILVDTGTTLDGKINTIDTNVDSILVDTGTTLDGKINTIDTNVDSILADTGTDGVKVASTQLFIKKNTELANFMFVMTDDTNHAPTSGLTVTATRSIDGGAFASCANAVSGVANGVYKITLAAADLNGTTIVLRFTATDSDDRLIGLITQA